MICNYCGIEFTPLHFNQRLCSSECKTAAIIRAKQKYKESEKGKISNEKWVCSERRKENEKRYRDTPHRRRLAVLAVKRYLQVHPEAMEKKRERDREYGRSERGREVNNAAQVRYHNTPHGRLIRRIAKHARRNAPGTFSKEEWENKLISYNYRCAHCGTTDNIEIDHIIPLTLGGTNTIENLQPLCRSCNASKGGRYVG